jgi:hypothetical protein
VTGLHWPSRRVAGSLPGLRLAVLVAVAGPVFVLWAGRESDTGLRLLLIGLVAGVALALVWDDRCAALTAATPVGLPAVRRGRAVLLAVALVAGWGTCAWAADRAEPDIPVAAIAVPVLAMAAVLLAAIGLLARGREGEPIGAYPVPVLLLLLLLLSRLPDRWTLLVSPAGAGWAQVRDRWLLLLAASAAVAIWMLRDPAARPVPAFVRPRVRRTL